MEVSTSIFTRVFQNFLNKHATQKKVRGNHALFMTKDLNKAVMNKSKTRNRHLKWPSRENVLAMKSAKTPVINQLKPTKNLILETLHRKVLLIISHSGIQSNHFF